MPDTYREGIKQLEKATKRLFNEYQSARHYAIKLLLSPCGREKRQLKRQLHKWCLGWTTDP